MAVVSSKKSSAVPGTAPIGAVRGAGPNRGRVRILGEGRPLKESKLEAGTFNIKENPTKIQSEVSSLQSKYSTLTQQRVGPKLGLISPPNENANVQVNLDLATAPGFSKPRPSENSCQVMGGQLGL